ncbi:MAG: UDP-glucose/GDP-mannose dehydrogenase family protein [candidate division WOR-3 bacterium]
MKVTVIGLGYVGLVTSIGLAELGHDVMGYDVDVDKISKLKGGHLPIFEPLLDEIFQKNLGNKFNITTSPEEAVLFGDIIFICTGTPTNLDWSVDLTQVEEAAKTVAWHIDRFKLVVEKSTVPVNTARWIERTIKLYLRRSVDFEVASNPEFLREGNAVQDFFKPDRIVIGVQSARAKRMLRELYKPLKAPVVITDINTAELIKHASNAFLAMKISFINMISDLCEHVGADVEVVAKAMGLDRRIGKEFLKAGIGYGGSCFPKDVKALYHIGKEYNLNFELLRCVHEINESRIDVFFNHIKKALWNVRQKKLAMWGLSFKPNTDDIREAPSLKVIKRILEQGGDVTLYDPVASENVKRVYPPSEKVHYALDMYEAVEGKDALLIITEWDIFKNADLQKVKKLLATPIIIDGRNIYDPKKMKKLGFEYYCMGRKA